MNRSIQDQTPGNKSTGNGTLYNFERSLARLGGDRVLFGEVVVMFLEDSPRLMTEARGALARQDTKGVALAAHSLKNLAATFDAAALTEAALAIEQRALDGELARVEGLFDDMQQELVRLQDALAGYVAPPGES